MCVNASIMNLGWGESSQIDWIIDNGQHTQRHASPFIEQIGLIIDKAKDTMISSLGEFLSQQSSLTVISHLLL